MDITNDASNNLGTTKVRVMGTGDVCNSPSTDRGNYRYRCFMASTSNNGNATVTIYTYPTEDEIQMIPFSNILQV
jgi:hypothetical protein